MCCALICADERLQHTQEHRSRVVREKYENACFSTAWTAQLYINKPQALEMRPVVQIVCLIFARIDRRATNN